MARSRLAEAGLIALGRDLPRDGGIQRRIRRLAARAGPQPLRAHRLDHRLAAHGFLRGSEYLDGRLDLAELAVGWLGRGLPDLLGLGLLLRRDLLGRRLLLDLLRVLRRLHRTALHFRGSVAAPGDHRPGAVRTVTSRARGHPGNSELDFPDSAGGEMKTTWIRRGFPLQGFARFP